MNNTSYSRPNGSFQLTVTGHWSEQCKNDLLDLDLPIKLDYFEGRPHEAFKTMANKKTKEFALDKFRTMNPSLKVRSFILS